MLTSVVITATHGSTFPNYFWRSKHLTHVTNQQNICQLLTEIHFVQFCLFAPNQLIKPIYILHIKFTEQLAGNTLQMHWSMCVCACRRLTASRRVNHGLGVGGAGVCGLLPPEPVGVACCRGAVRNRETRWAASHRRSAPRHTHLWCTKPHHQGNKTWPHRTQHDAQQQQQQPRCHKTSSSTFC